MGNNSSRSYELIFYAVHEHTINCKILNLNRSSRYYGIIACKNPWSSTAKFGNSYSYISHIHISNAESEFLFRRGYHSDGFFHDETTQICLKISDIYSINPFIHVLRVEQVYKSYNDLEFLIGVETGGEIICKHTGEIYYKSIPKEPYYKMTYGLINGRLEFTKQQFGFLSSNDIFVSKPFEYSYNTFSNYNCSSKIVKDIEFIPCLPLKIEDTQLESQNSCICVLQ